MDERQIKELPANICRSYREYQKEDGITRKMELMLNVYKQTIQYFGCIFLSEYLWDGSRNNDTVNGFIRQLARPSLGSWVGLVREYAKKYCRSSKEGASWVEGFWECYKPFFKTKCSVKEEYKGRFRDEASEAANEIDELANLRNKIAHGAMYPTDEEAKTILEVYAPCMERILDSFAPFFARYKVAKCVDSDDYDEETGEDCFVAWFDLINYESVENERYKLCWSEDTDKLGADPDSFFPKESDGQAYFYLLDMAGSDASDGQDGETRILRFSEILVEILTSEIHEDYLVYDGYTNANVTYLGVEAHLRISDYVDAIRNRFTSRGSNLRWTRHDFTMEGFRNYVNELSHISVEMHKENSKYDSRLYIPRACDEIVKNFLESDKTTLLVTAEAGAGKTCFLCHTAELLMNHKERYAVYFFNGSSLGQHADSTNILFRKLEEESLENDVFLSSQDFLSYINSQNKDGIMMVIIIDAVNEAVNTLNILTEIGNITAESGQYPWLKIIASIRSASYERILAGMDTNGAKLGLLTMRNRFYFANAGANALPGLEIERWNQYQVVEAYNTYRKHNIRRLSIPDFNALGEEMKTLLSSPLNMHLFFSLASKIQVSGIRSDADLFEAMDAEMSESDFGKKAVRLQDMIVRHMMDIRRNQIDSDKADEFSNQLVSEYGDKRLIVLSPLEQLLEEGIVYERDVPVDDRTMRMLAFVYQKYLEYKISKTIDVRQPLEEFAEAFIDTLGWDEIPEAFMAYAAALDRMRDYKNVLPVIFEKLSDRGVSPEAFRKVIVEYGSRCILDAPEDECDGVLKEVLELLADNGKSAWGADIVEQLHRKTSTLLAEKASDTLLARSDLDDEVRRELYFRKAMVCQNRSQYEQTIDFLESAKEGETDAWRLNRATVQLAKTQRKNKNVDVAEEILSDFMKSRQEDAPFYPEALIQRGLCKVEKKNYEDALGDYEDALAMAKRQDDYHTQAYDLLGISTVYRNKAVPDKAKAKEALMRVFEISSRYGYLDLLSDCLHALAELCLEDGDYRDSRQYTDQTIMLWERSGHYEGLAIMYIIRAILVSIPEGRTDSDGEDAYDIALARAEELHGYINNDAVEREYQKYMKELMEVRGDE